MLLVDTDVLIWYLRGNQKAYQVIENLDDFSISVVTYMELVQGMKNKNELKALRRALLSWNATILYISEGISAKAMFYVEEHFLSHSMELADALIAASAITNGLKLLTANIKHYNVLPNLELVKFRPDIV